MKGKAAWRPPEPGPGHAQTVPLRRALGEPDGAAPLPGPRALSRLRPLSRRSGRTVEDRSLSRPETGCATECGSPVRGPRGTHLGFVAVSG